MAFTMQPASPADSRRIVAADRVLDVRSGEYIVGGAVAVIGDRIESVGPLDTLGGPGVAIESFPGHTIIPGLINSHVHLTISHTDVARPSRAHPDTEVERILAASRRLAECLAVGITTVRDVGASDRGIFALRSAVERGDVLGSRIIASGALLCATGGHAYRIGHQADGAAGMRNAARTEIKAGADFIKIMIDGGTSDAALDVAQPSLTDEEIAAATDVAHRLGRRVTAHAIAPLSIDAAIRAGVDSIEHGYALDAVRAAAMQAAGIALVPTMSVHAAVLRQSDDVLADVWWIDQVRRARELSRAAVSAAIEAGVSIAAGTDGVSPFNPHHDLVGVLELLVEAGMTPLQAIRSATSVAAEIADASDRVGALREGLLADMVVVDGDPLDDMTALRRPFAVYLNGQLVVDARGSHVAAH